MASVFEATAGKAIGYVSGGAAVRSLWMMRLLLLVLKSPFR
jgi:hypothetical protein